LWLTLYFHPSFACRHPHAEGIFQGLQELDIVGVEGLQRARAFKLQRSSFCHVISRKGDLQIAHGRAQTAVPCASWHQHSVTEIRKPAPNGCVPPATLRSRR